VSALWAVVALTSSLVGHPSVAGDALTIHSEVQLVVFMAV